VDILADFIQTPGISFIDLADELEDILQAKVDLVSRNAIKPAYFEKIQKDIKYV
jgi:predicted nucleotidyltransferase